MVNKVTFLGFKGYDCPIACLKYPTKLLSRRLKSISLSLTVKILLSPVSKNFYNVLVIKV